MLSHGFYSLFSDRSNIAYHVSTDRYRVQSDAYEGLWLITSELVRRVTTMQPDVRLTVQDQPGLGELALLVDEHFQVQYCFFLTLWSLDHSYGAADLIIKVLYRRWARGLEAALLSIWHQERQDIWLSDIYSTIYIKTRVTYPSLFGLVTDCKNAMILFTCVKAGFWRDGVKARKMFCSFLLSGF